MPTPSSSVFPQLAVDELWDCAEDRPIGVTPRQDRQLNHVDAGCVAA